LLDLPFWAKGRWRADLQQCGAFTSHSLRRDDERSRHPVRGNGFEPTLCARVTRICACSLELELRLLFRELQRKQHPMLTRDEWLPLYQIWLDGYIATLEARERRWHAHVCETVGIS
jgi:hypothetical protein